MTLELFPGAARLQPAGGFVEGRASGRGAAARRPVAALVRANDGRAVVAARRRRRIPYTGVLIPLTTRCLLTKRDLVVSRASRRRASTGLRCQLTARRERALRLA